MNLFELYRSAVLRHLGQKSFTTPLRNDLSRAFKNLRGAYFGAGGVDYSDEMTRLCYALHFAPKHAIVWREYCKGAGWSTKGDVKLNSLGTGCGAEVIGIMEGMNNGAVTSWDWWCCDAEPAWRPVLDAVVEEYGKKRAVALQTHWVPTLGDLQPERWLIGSLVLSEVVRQGQLKEWRQEVRTALNPPGGYFLDVTTVKMGGTSSFLSDVCGFGFENLKKRGIQVKDVINAEMAAVNDLPCNDSLKNEPSLNMFFPKF